MVSRTIHLRCYEVNVLFAGTFPKTELLQMRVGLLFLEKRSGEEGGESEVKRSIKCIMYDDVRTLKQIFNVNFVTPSRGNHPFALVLIIIII